MADGETGTVALRREAGVAWVTLDRPERRNASNLAMKARLLAVFREIEGDGEIRAVVLTGAGGTFCSGGDLKESKTYTVDQYRLSLARHHGVCTAIRDLDRPVVAAIAGYALAGGLEMAMMCDIRIAERSAKLGIPVVKAGSVSTAGLYHQLVRCIGLTRTARLALTGDLLAAPEAERIGLVSEVVPDGEVEAAAGALARRMADHPPLSLAAAKQALRRAGDADFATMLDLDAALAAAARGG